MATGPWTGLAKSSSKPWVPRWANRPALPRRRIRNEPPDRERDQSLAHRARQVVKGKLDHGRLSSSSSSQSAIRVVWWSSIVWSSSSSGLDPFTHYQPLKAVGWNGGLGRRFRGRATDCSALMRKGITHVTDSSLASRYANVWSTQPDMGGSSEAFMSRCPCARGAIWSRSPKMRSTEELR